MTLKVYFWILARFLVFLAKRGCREEVPVLLNVSCKAHGFLGFYLERESYAV